MAVILLTNRSAGWLVLWLEPLGEDRWLKPGETVRVRSDYDGEAPAFEVTFWVRDEDRAAGIENVDVSVESGSVYAQVTDAVGRVLPCGYQRPEAVDRAWKAAFAEAQRRRATS